MNTEDIAAVGAETETQIENPVVETKVETSEPNEEAKVDLVLTDAEKAEADAKASEAAKTLAERKKEKSRERWNEMRDRGAAAEQRAIRAEQQLVAMQAALKAPDPSQYDDNAKYTADVVKHAVKESEAERYQSEVKSARDESVDISKRQWQEKVIEAKEEYPDFETVAYNPQITYTPAMTEAVIAAPNSTKVAYELGKNPVEANRISRLPPFQQAMEIGRISANLSVPVEKKITQAPAPIKSVAGRSSPPPLDPEKMNFSQFKAYREKGGTP